MATSSPNAVNEPVPPCRLTRRGVFGVAGAGGIALLFHELVVAKPLGRPLPQALPHVPGSPVQPSASPHWSGPPGRARFRIEGLAKVTGQKIYARDFRARDLPGWPQTERLALILRASRVDEAFAGLDLSRLPLDAQPLLVIAQTALPGLTQPQRDLASLNLKLPFSTTAADGVQQLLVPVGARAQFYGQAVAMLLFADFNTFRRAKRALQFQPEVIRYQPAATEVVSAASAASCPPQQQVHAPLPAYAPVNYLTRYEAEGLAPFSQVQIGAASDPFKPDSQSQPWNSTARRMRELVDAEFAKPELLQFEGRYQTQVLDTMFMEPEAGLAWLDGGTLNLLLGTQATNGDMGDTLGLFSLPCCPIKVTQVGLYSCYPGGGFGGRDVSTFPPLLAVAAALADGPVRIVQDRYEQFQSGLKQLSSDIRQRIAVERESGRFVAFSSSQVLSAGGNNNYSQFVAMLAGYCGLSGYDVRKAYVDAIAKPSSGVVAGSMRGFGGPQASFAVERLVDEVAVALKRDPIELRERNALQQFDRTITGAPLEQGMRLVEICRRARAHPLWRQRETRRREAQRRGQRYGVGFALANQAYGTGTDGVMAEVAITAEGRLSVRTNCVDMGNGSATTLAISTAAWAGQNAHEIQMGDVGSFNALAMVSGSDNGSWSQANWTASFAMSSSACLTAFHQVHVTEQASRVLFETALLPAAAKLWGKPLVALQGRTVWRDGLLSAPGLPPLALPQLSARVFADGLPSGAMVHGLYQGDWVSASYPLAEGRLLALPIDGLALRQGKSWQVVTRQDLVPPSPQAALYGRSLYAPSGALIAVEIDERSCEPRVVAVQLFVDAGKVLQPDLLIGQAQGGIAMGIGYALLEDLPLEAGGAGDGRWNLDRYHVALAGDLPLDAMHVELLGGDDATAKGIAEAVLCPIAPAIANAVAAACDQRFQPRQLPIRAADIKKALTP